MGVALADRTVSQDAMFNRAGERVHEPGVAVPGLPPSPRAADSRARVIDAALRCIARFGVKKTTIDDIAREARLSRATLYRTFPGGRDQVFESMVAREVGRFFEDLAANLEAVDSLEDRLVIAMESAARRIVSHEALGYVMAHEPELLLPHVSFAEFDSLLDVTASFLAPYLAGFVEPEDARRVGEWVTRLVVSHVGCPTAAIDEAWSAPRVNTSEGSGSSPFAVHPGGLGEERVRWLVRQFVLPGVASLASCPDSAACAADEASSLAPTPSYNQTA